MKIEFMKIWIFILVLGFFSWQVNKVHAQNFSNVAYMEDEENAEYNEAILIPAQEAKTKSISITYDIAEFEGESTYTLGKSDVIEIIVQRHPEVSGAYPVNMEGNIQYEFVGDVNLEGMTKEEAKNKLTELLSTYIVSPSVTVKIIGYNSKVVYVIGEVARPGKIFMRGDTIRIREALVQAGLPLLSGALRKGKLITPSEDGKPKNIKVDVDALLYKGDLRENIVMNPGDTLYIPATGLTKVMRAISPVTTPVSSIAGTGRTVTTGF